MLPGGYLGWSVIQQSFLFTWAPGKHICRWTVLPSSATPQPPALFAPSCLVSPSTRDPWTGMVPFGLAVMARVCRLSSGWELLCVPVLDPVARLRSCISPMQPGSLWTGPSLLPIHSPWWACTFQRAQEAPEGEHGNCPSLGLMKTCILRHVCLTYSSSWSELVFPMSMCIKVRWLHWCSERLPS
jgi:hypothetical protein